MAERKSILTEANPKAVAARLKLGWAMLTHPRTGCLVKLAIVIGAIWVIFPDLAPGMVDDFIVSITVLYLLPEFLPAPLQRELKGKSGVED